MPPCDSDMDAYTVISIGLVIPALGFLIGVAVAASWRLAGREARSLWWDGVTALPIAVGCARLDEARLAWPAEMAVSLVQLAAGMTVAYAAIAACTWAVRGLWVRGHAH